jgi:hypothetical protein
MENEILNENQRVIKKSARRQWKICGLIFAVYTFWLIVQIPQIYFYNIQSTQPVAWWLAIGRLALAIYIWAFLSPLVFKLGKRFPIGYRHLWRNLLLHSFFSFIFGVVQAVSYLFGVSLMSSGNLDSAFNALSNPGYFLNFLSNAAFHYTAVLAIHQAYQHFRESQDREFRLQQAELQTLKTQLHPHFLFNTLNAISSLVSSSPKAAQKLSLNSAICCVFR